MEYKVKKPLVAKLLAIISLIVLFSIGSITTAATFFFAEDTRIRSEESNLTFNQLISQEMESGVSSLRLGALSLLDTLRESGGNQTREEIAIGNYFDRNPVSVWVCVPGSRRVANEKFLEAWGIDPSVPDAMLEARNEYVERARAGESILANATPWLGIPSAALFVPYRDFGAEDALVILFSSERLQGLVQTKSENRSYAVARDGELIASPDADLLARGENRDGEKIVRAFMDGQEDNMQFRYVGTDGVEYIGAFRAISLGSFAVVTTIPVSTLYAGAVVIARRNLYITGIVLLLSFLIVWFFARSMSRPVISLVGAAKQIEAGKFDLDIVPTTHDELGLLTESFIQMGKGLSERERIKETFGKFVNKDIVEQAIAGGLSLGGVRRTATIMFSDIRGFTAISESLPPEGVVEMLNGYMTRMVGCIEKTRGTVDKFIGDAIMAVWGAPVTKGTPAEDAFECVLSMLLMRKVLREFNQDRGGPDRPIIRIGCGANTGDCLAGQIGSTERMEYTVIGDAVNLASRIEALNKPFATDILISENTYRLIGDRLVVEPMPSIKVKGKKDPLHIYAVVNVRGVKGPRTLAEVRDYLGMAPPGKLEAPEEEHERKYEILES